MGSLWLGSQGSPPPPHLYEAGPRWVSAQHPTPADWAGSSPRVTALTFSPRVKRPGAPARRTGRELQALSPGSPDS